MTQPTDDESLKTYETEDGSMSLSYSGFGLDWDVRRVGVALLTGTFFCDSTTAHFFPLMPTDRMFAPVIALKAYSENDDVRSSIVAIKGVWKES